MEFASRYVLRAELDAAEAALPHVPRDLATDCARALAEATELRLTLEGGLQGALEIGATGRGNERDIRAKLGAVRSVITERREQLAAQQREADARSLLDVLHRFPGPGRRYEHLVPGESIRITAEQKEELGQWRVEMEADRDLHGWDAPAGFTPETWPPFTILTPAPVPAPA